MNSKQIREEFFNFFRTKEHRIVPSAPMVLKNDPTLMFTNAGMNQFKDIFLGNEQADIKRVANTQKCLRVSGKHNDLEEVGHDTYHHTMFEMLGNWSFGDYFKKEAIEWAWEFLTEVVKIDKERIYATVFEGSREDKLDRDNEAAGFWLKCFENPENRILNGSKKDNFWEMGDTGPCGPCSEIHVDIRPESERKNTPGHELVNKDHPLVIEIWNLVFIQYNRKADGSLETLPQKHVDTGMGFERLCMIIQAKESNYDTDIFQGLIKEISAISGIDYGKSDNSDIAMRVIADHLRAVSFSIADGQLPSNNKAGYVIRRILRRAIRYGFTYLNIEEPFIFRLIPVLVKLMGDTFPEIKAQEEQIFKVIHQEETTFLNTLGKGIKLIEKKIKGLETCSAKVFPGKDAFTLYDTYGFPVDLTELILNEKSMTVDREGFSKAMSQQKIRSKADAAKETDDWVILSEQSGTLFTGYTKDTEKVKITRYRRIKIKGKEEYQLVFDKTPFYAEAGGQVGDKGYITNGDEKINIINIVKENNLTLHIAETIPEFPYDYFEAVIDRRNRRLTANNHTATHLMHHALRKILGDHVEQKGSLVTAEKLRFDFSHFEKVSREQIFDIENMVNRMIRADLRADVTEGISMDEALDMGAIALFGEKYGDKVRVIKFDDSVELCGGTHVKSTSQIGFFRIISESAIAAGIRRIEAITSDRAFDFINKQLSMVDEISSMLSGSKNIPGTIAKMVQEIDDLSRKVSKLEIKASSVIKKELINRTEKLGDISYVSDRIELDSTDMMKNIASMIRSSQENTVLAIGSMVNGKAHLLVAISDDLVRNRGLHAGNIIREVAPLIKGGGGGQPFLATAGGSNTDGIEDALAKIRNIINSARH